MCVCVCVCDDYSLSQTGRPVEAEQALKFAVKVYMYMYYMSLDHRRLKSHKYYIIIHTHSSVLLEPLYMYNIIATNLCLCTQIY